MNETRTAVIVIVLGMLGLADGGFNYFREARAAETMSVQASIGNTGIYSVSFWLGCGAIFSGMLLLIIRTRNFPISSSTSAD